MNFSIIKNAATARIERVELFLLNVETARHFSHGVWRNRQHAVLQLGGAAQSGWGECVAATNRPELDLAQWGAVLGELKGRTPDEAWEILRLARDVWPNKTLEMAEMALLDWCARLAGTPLLELLDLPLREPVAGLFCVLESQPEKAAERARFALEKNLKTHIKLKIFGDLALDCALIRAVRAAMGPRAFVVADANGAYTARGENLVAQLKKLRESGLDALEDPAKLEIGEWVELQNAVGDLALVPDEPLRPAWRAQAQIAAGMGRIYNIHPGTSGSLLEAIALARQIQNFGAQVMIGDDSLVGPACSAWQQLAIGLGASWCEALEKPDESSAFSSCIRAQNTRKDAEGRVELGELKPGFGLEVDAEKLRKNLVFA